MAESEMSALRFAPLTKLQLHPVFQLEDFLQSVVAVDTDGEQITQEQAIVVDGKRDRAISVAEFLFGSSLLTAALTLLDNYQQSFTKISSPHRSLWLIRGSSDLAYMCFACDETPDLYYCNCRSYLEKMSKKPAEEESLPEMCKHLLALKLIPVLQIVCPHLIVSDKEFAKVVLERTLKGGCE